MNRWEITLTSESSFIDYVDLWASGEGAFVFIDGDVARYYDGFDPFDVKPDSEELDLGNCVIFRSDSLDSLKNKLADLEGVVVLEGTIKKVDDDSQD